MQRASIYNPGLGDQDNIKEQLILHYGNDTVDQQLTHIGVAQGLAELSNSFDGHPVSWIKTATNLMVLYKVEDDGSDNWRHGFWIYATVSLDDFPYFVICSIRDAYRHFRLFNGTFATCLSKESRSEFTDWWLNFFDNWSSDYRLGALAGPAYLRLVSGVLSPDIKDELEHIRIEHSFSDILISSSVDYAFIWPGSHLDRSVRVDIQNWLTGSPCDNCDNVDNSSQKQGETILEPQQSSASEQVQMSTPDPEIGDVTQTDITLLSQINDINAIPATPTGGGFFSDMSVYLPNMSYMSIGSLPTMPNTSGIFSRTHVPSMPSIDGFKRSIESVRSYFDPSHDVSVDNPPISKVIHSVNIIVDNKPFHLISYQKNSVIFTFISEKRFDWTTTLESTCIALARDLEGVSFALDPPSQFEYMVIDSCAESIVSTIPPPKDADERQAHELISRLLQKNNKNENEVMRSKSNWWLQRTLISKTMEIVFCKKCTDADIADLLGALQHGVGDWVKSYCRRRGL